jgi:hypothetical protein
MQVRLHMISADAMDGGESFASCPGPLLQESTSQYPVNSSLYVSWCPCETFGEEKNLLPLVVIEFNFLN